MDRFVFFSSWDRRAQALVEVAIFGVIIISIIGMIVKNVVSTSFAQQQALRIVREALSEAEKEHRIYDPTLPGNVRVQKPYNLMVIEDRLIAGATKYGVTERMPYSFRANGVFSRDLFGGAYDLSAAPGSYGTFNIPALHLKINGILYPFALGAWRRFEETESCYQPVRRSPGFAGAAWETKPLNEEDFKDILAAQGSVPCWKTGYSVKVFLKPHSGNPPQYYAIDPSVKTPPPGYHGVINPFRTDLGLDKKMVIQTASSGSLTVQPDKNKSTALMEQTDVIRRGIKTNSGYVWAITRLSGTRRHPW